jgi:hypothetical protein
MKRIMYLAVGVALIIACLFSNLGCASVHKDVIAAEMNKPPERAIPQLHLGWNSMGETGHHWTYLCKNRNDIFVELARCEYQYIKIKGVEMWRGTYFGKMTSFQMKKDPFTKGRLDGLYRCVEWVRHHRIGDWYI